VESPTWSNRKFFESRVLAHRAVTGLKRDGDVYEIERDSRPTVRVFLTNSYVVGLAEYYDICGKASDVDAIVTISPYNSVSGDAWRQGQDDGIGVFQFKEFYGALNYDGDGFVRYVPPDARRGAR
jgi:hypothetical protein